MILTLIRHGEPARDATGTGRADPPLSPLGRHQLEVARALIEADGYEAVFCSPLRRARESAACLLPDIAPVIDDDLAEFDRDAAEYVHWEDAPGRYQHYLAGDLSAWGTSLTEFRVRIGLVVERMRRACPEGNAIAVTHGGLINNFFAMLVGSQKVSLFQPAYGSVNRFLHLPDEGWTPMELNALAAR